MWNRIKQLFSRSGYSGGTTPAKFDEDGFLNELYEKRRFTPDLPQLEGQTSHLFFACDELQRDHWQNHLLDAGTMKPYSAFSQQHLMMLNNDMGIFSTSLIFKDQLGYNSPPPLLPIKGEVYEIPPRTFLLLDEHKKNTVYSFRQLVPIVIPLTHIFSNDRSVLEKALKRSRTKETVSLHKDRSGRVIYDKNNKPLVRDGGSLQTNMVQRDLVHRVWAWMYFSDPNYWEDFINLNGSNHPVRSFDIAEGPIKKYYRYTQDEYKGYYAATDDPPWK